MSSYQGSDETFLRDRLRTYSRRQAQPASPFGDRISEPPILVTVLLLLATLAYSYYGSSVFEEFLPAIGQRSWDLLVYITPSSLLHPLDSWMHPQPPQTMIDSQTNPYIRKSEAMKRILGLNRSGGMMATVLEARTRALSLTGSALGFKGDLDRPPGLGNRDNSCFQNSILQALASLDPFQKYLEACLSHSPVDTEVSRAVAQTLHALLVDLNDVSNNGKTLWTPHGLKYMSTWQQQDAQEYYSKMLDDIEKSALHAAKVIQQHDGFEPETNLDDSTTSQHSDDSGYQSLSSVSRLSATNVLRNPLDGLAVQRVTCAQCGYSDGLSMIPFNCLTLSLGLGRGQHDLYERLDAYSQVESIEGVECPKCTLLKAERLLTKLVEMLQAKDQAEKALVEPLRRLTAVKEALEEDDFDEKTLSEKCKISSQSKVTTTKTKQVAIARPPQCLAIHMQRSVFDPSTFDMVKNAAPVEFPRTLDIGPWCLGSAKSANITKTPFGAEEQWLLDPYASMVAGDLQPSKLVGPIYELSAVITHTGRHDNGHYICYRRFPKHKLSDSSVTSSGVADENGDVDDMSTQEKANTDTQVGEERQGEEKDETEWWTLSDHHVFRVGEELISNLSPGVFMLFYNCVDPSMILQPDDEAGQGPLETTEGHVNGQEQAQGQQVDDDEADAQSYATPTEGIPLISSVTAVDSAPPSGSTIAVNQHE